MQSKWQKFWKDGDFLLWGFNGFVSYKPVPGWKHSERAYHLRYRKTVLLTWWSQDVSGGTLGMDIVRPKLAIPQWFPRWVHEAHTWYRRKTHTRWKQRQATSP